MKSSAEIDAKYRRMLFGQLVFGNAEQIKLLHKWRQEIDNFEGKEQAGNDSNAPLIKWRVGYSYRREYNTTVEARTRGEAKEKVREEYDYKDDFEIEWIEKN